MRARERAIGPRELTLPVAAAAMAIYGMFSGLAGSVAVALIVLGSGMFFISMLLPTLTEFQIGPGGFSAKLRERDQEIKATLEPESESLLRTATELAGNPEAGKKLLDQALVETYMRWQQAKQEGPADAVRRHLGDLAPASAEAPGGAP
jgi:hypothetical protein